MLISDFGPGEMHGARWLLVSMHELSSVDLDM